MGATDFNPVSMMPLPMCGYWTDHNSLGVHITFRNKVQKDFAEYRHRLKSDGRDTSINFLRYVAFLADPKHRKLKMSAAEGYELRKQKARERQQMMSLTGRDIGDLPEVQNPERKESCRNNFRLFCETYFHNTFTLEWSEDHLRIIGKIEQSVIHGGLFAMALPRGTGKSSLCEASCLWAMIYGHRDFVCLIGATESAALEMLESIKTEFETNELLHADFPEVCYPIQRLDGIAHRCNGQLYHGERTRITWTNNELSLPVIEGSVASGAIIRVAGLTGRIRGMKSKRFDGESVRPELVVVDDPQTTESADSIEQTRKRVRILIGDVLGLAGPGKKIAGLMPCTVIRNGDMADQILDRGKHPEWNGERTKMIYDFPENTKLWEDYAEIRAESLRCNGNIQEATEFYREHQAEMDKGARVAWPSRYNPDEISAIQHAMNLKIMDEMAFRAEYQNEPIKTDTATDNLLSVDAICQLVNGLPRGTMPLSCTKVTMFVDIQKTLLFWVICAWADNFTGAVIDYGAWPDQGRIRFTLSDAYPTFKEKFPNAGVEGQIYGALQALFKEQMSREFVREDGAVFHIKRALIDANWGYSTDVVYQFCRQSEYAGLVNPSHGRYIGASSKPMTEYKKKPGEELGYNWYMPLINGKRAYRHVVFDSNFWKSFVHSRLSVAPGDPGNLSLFGKNILVHQLFAEHLTSEYRVKTEGRGRIVDEWKLRVNGGENHWLDGLAGCAVAASMEGSAIAEGYAFLPKKRAKISISQVGKNPQAIAETPLVSGTGMPVKQKIRLSDLQKKR